ncbi:nitrate- and nitrite sensing domain-containing protein [Nonomuraea sp. NPDC047897]|uniref:sensor histidine kinase n=1 Tax=Nonomuraea sp. NPDC047897 TaxID=3364346 RepID=UPI00371B54A4
MRSRLVALILIPTVVGVLLAGVQLANAINTSTEYRKLTQLAEVVQRVNALNHELGKERTLTAWYMADRRRPTRLTALRAQRQAVDKAKEGVLTAVSAIDATHAQHVLSDVSEIRRWLRGIDGLRESILDGDSVPPRAAIRTFSTMIDTISHLQTDLANGVSDEDLQENISALGGLARAKEEVSRQQAILVVALIGRRLDYDDLSDFLGSWNRQQAEQAVFEQSASAADLQAYRRNLRGLQIDRADAMRQRALAQMREYQRIADLDVTSARDITLWHDSTAASVNAMRKVEDGLTTRIVTQTRDLSDGEQRNAIISGAMILVLLLLVLIFTTRVAGSLVRPLRRLRAEALQVATTRLPETVRVLRESGDGAAVPEVPSIGINTRDEIGEVARAFDEVHREAIRLAGDEAKLRANVNAMFVNLSRRSQTLVERQLQLIEGLEQGEEDEQRLANLFRLDHLATRMRRNSENLLVLAGQEGARKWSEPVPLVDVARASLSEVENYERVQIQIPSGIQIVGPAVTDTVHLLAELIENAISFSPRESKVQVTQAPADGGVLVTINDLGIGMTNEELAEANWRLANPPVVDVAVSRRMGLFVVGRLALRHGIRVQLRMRDTGGLSAMVMVPDTLIAGAPGAPAHGQYDAFTSFDPSAMEPAANGAYAAPSAPAAPMGFGTDDVPVNTEWPGNLPVPGGTGTSWPSFAEEPPKQAEEPRWPSFAEEPPPPAQQERWPSFADGAAQADEPRWPSFATEPPPPAAQEEPRWPSFATEPPPLDPAQQETRWPPVGEQPLRSSMFDAPEPAQPARPSPFAADGPEQPPYGAGEMPWPSFAETAKPSDPYERNGHSAFDPFGPGEYSSQDLTGPLPVVRSSPMEEQSEDFLPIFSSVGSDWFRKPDPEQLQPRPEPRPEFQPEHQQTSWDAASPEPEEPETAVQPAVRLDAEPPAELRRQAPDSAERPGALPRRRPGESGVGASWSSPADSGWQAAQAAAEPAQGGTTASGLPRRVPKANLVPGTASLAEPQAASPAPQISPERLRSRLSSFQQGVRQGRAFTRGEENEEDK